MTLRRTHTILAAAAVLALWAGSAWAAAGADGGHHELPWTDFAFRVVNFILVIGIIYKFAGKQIKEFFVGRRENIQAELDDLAARRSETEAKLAEVEKSIANIEAEKKAILDEYRAQGENLKASIIAEAHKKAEAIAANAQLAAGQEAKLAIENLRAEMAEQVVDAAAKALKKKLDKDSQQKLIDDSLTKVVLN